MTNKIDINERLQEAVQSYWNARTQNKGKQAKSGKIDAGSPLANHLEAIERWAHARQSGHPSHGPEWPLLAVPGPTMRLGLLTSSPFEMLRGCRTFPMISS